MNIEASLCWFVSPSFSLSLYRLCVVRSAESRRACAASPKPTPYATLRKRGRRQANQIGKSEEKPKQKQHDQNKPIAAKPTKQTIFKKAKTNKFILIYDNFVSIITAGRALSHKSHWHLCLCIQFSLSVPPLFFSKPS